MYCILYRFSSGLNYGPIFSLHDSELETVIYDLKTYSPRDVCLHHTIDEAKAFESMLITLSDTYFNGDLNLALTEFQNYLEVNDLDLIMRLQDILYLPLADRKKAMDELIDKMQDYSRYFQANLLTRYNSGQTGPLP